MTPGVELGVPGRRIDHAPLGRGVDRAALGGEGGAQGGRDITPVECGAGCRRRVRWHGADPRGVRGWRSAEGPGPHRRRRRAAWSRARPGCGQALRPKACCPRHRWQRGGPCRSYCPAAATRLLAGSGGALRRPAPTNRAGTSAASGGRRWTRGPASRGGHAMARQSCRSRARLQRSDAAPLRHLPRQRDLLHHQHQRHPLSIVQPHSDHGRIALKASRTSKVARPQTGSAPKGPIGQSSHKP